jgi:hypothetical protein
MESRYGTSRMVGRLPKSLRIRFFSVKEYAIGLTFECGSLSDAAPPEGPGARTRRSGRFRQKREQAGGPCRQPAPGHRL